MDSYSPLTIALVDDDYIFRLTASKLLRFAQESVEVLQFQDGDEALRFLHEYASEESKLPDIILLDINMPNVDGWSFLLEFASLKNKLHKDIVIYMVSSSIDPNEINRAKSNAAVKDYLVKPISREDYQKLLEDFSKQLSN